MEFLDLKGASGTVYRFRRWSGVGSHPPIAGNYVLLAAGTHQLVEVGVLDDLSQAPRRLCQGKRLADHFDALLGRWLHG